MGAPHYAPEGLEEDAEVAEVIDDVTQEYPAEEVRGPGVAKHIPAACVCLCIFVTQISPCNASKRCIAYIH